jgi:HlyD family secretion protein
VNVDFNSEVRKGEVLARVDPSTYEQQLRQAEADLAAAEANHRLVVIDTERLRDLREQDLVTQQEYDQAQARLQQSEANLLTRRAEVENARVDLGRCTIVSPIDGIVILKQAEVGKTVAASLSAPTLFVIAQDLSKMRIVAPISEVDVGSVHPGQEVTFTVDALPERQFHGRLVQVRNPYTPSDRQQQMQAQRQSSIVHFDAIIEADNTDLLLRPSLTADVSIVVARRENVLRIPNSALRVPPPAGAIEPPAQASPAPAASSDGQEMAATVHLLPGGSSNAKLQAVTVQLGVSDNLMTEVLSGLSEGDVVVTGILPQPEPAARLPFF